MTLLAAVCVTLALSPHALRATSRHTRYLSPHTYIPNTRRALTPRADADDTAAAYPPATAANPRATSTNPTPTSTTAASDERGLSVPFAALPLLAPIVATTVHAPAFGTLGANLQLILESGATGDALWAPIRFWTFFAALHPLLQPAVGIGEVLHSSPGPLLGLLPLSFLAANLAALWLLAALPGVRGAVNTVLLGLFIHYVGCGLESTVGDYNLALDDGLRGCPTYEQVRQRSMDGFDVAKYQGRWYEHEFHDWTQFKEVYDTSFDIELSRDGTRWLDDFGIRGPSPTAAPISWDKSPVANGAHYFMRADVDAQTPGVIRESGFGVTFPNYIVDVQRDANGEYTEAIQFQCLESGGVRVFEGINFMSRSPTITDERLGAMHDRARAAGMDPYGTAPGQMVRVAHREPASEAIQNSWQDAWRFVGVDKLLQLLESSTHSAFEVSD